jgi:hypothetical protein
MRPRDENPPVSRDSNRKSSRDPKTIADALDGVLASIDLDLAAPIAAIGDNWVAIVGQEVAAHCRPAGVKAGVLHADVDSSVWCQQLQLRSPQILSALKRFLGEAAPTDLRFRVGYSPPLPEDGGPEE